MPTDKEIEAMAQTTAATLFAYSQMDRGVVEKLVSKADIKEQYWSTLPPKQRVMFIFVAKLSLEAAEQVRGEE